MSGELPAGRLPFSPSVSAPPFLFVSGQASVDQTGAIVTDTFEGEMRRSFENLKAVLAASKLNLRDVVQVRSYVGNQEDLEAYNRIYREYFTEPYPARTTLIGCLGTILKFEIDVTAYIANGNR